MLTANRPESQGLDRLTWLCCLPQRESVTFLGLNFPPGQQESGNTTKFISGRGLRERRMLSESPATPPVQPQSVPSEWEFPLLQPHEELKDLHRMPVYLPVTKPRSAINREGKRPQEMGISLTLAWTRLSRQVGKPTAALPLTLNEPLEDNTIPNNSLIYFSLKSSETRSWPHLHKLTA